MNTFHEINVMTSRGDVNGAFSLIRDRSESVARKIMKKAGYSVPVHTGRAFWVWVQEVLLKSAREQKNGYQLREERMAVCRGYRQKIHDDYEAYVQMMSGSGQEEERRPAENNITEYIKADETTGVETIPVRGCERVPENNHTHDGSLKRASTPKLLLHHLNGDMPCGIMKRIITRYVFACCSKAYSAIIISRACLYHLLLQFCCRRQRSASHQGSVWISEIIVR